MLRQIKSLIAARSVVRKTAEDTSESDELALAAIALMLEAAHLDEDFGAPERAEIRALVAKRFELTPEHTDRLLAEAEAMIADSHQLYGFTRVLKDQLSYEERVEFMEMLWQVSYADGQLHDYEANLMRRVAGLLYVEDRDSGAARKRALRRLAMDG